METKDLIPPRKTARAAPCQSLLLALGLTAALAGCGDSPPPPAAASDEPTTIETPVAAAHYESADPLFGDPYIDIDEWRDEPVRHRYVHGGFTDTATRFSYYFPPADQYEGRFFQYITPVPDSETLSQGASGEEDRIGFAIASGAYFIETNGGGNVAAAMPGTDSDPTIGAYRANAAAAAYSRVVAMNMYDAGRPYGYAFGGSGGGFRTLAGMENTEGVWDGAVPFVIGSPMALPNVFTVRAYAMRVVGDQLADVADAVDVGSNRDPFTDVGLDEEQRGALREATRLGFPLAGWHAHEHLGLHAFALLFPGVVAADPSYFEDFWTQPGYEGYAPTPSLKRALIDHTTTVEKLISVDDALSMGLEVGHLAGRPRGLADDAWKAMQGEHAVKLPVGIQLKDLPAQPTLGADLLIASGDAAGEALPLARLEGDIALFNPGSDDAVAAIAVGDQVRFDNRNFLAVQTYHRHQVPAEGFPVWDQFRDEDGKPRYPQRPVILGPRFAMGATGTAQTGNFKGKMIVVENLYDTEAFPWQADWYRTAARQHWGEQLDEHFRLWFTDHANHGDSSEQRNPTHTVSYLGVLQQALRDLAAWVERGEAPPSTTRYQVVDGQVQVPDSADRGGIQPVVSVMANGAERAEVTPGEPVTLVAEVAVPPGTGEIVSASWDLDGSGDFAIAGEIAATGNGRATVSLSHVFDTAGTYFPTLRVASQRQGDAETPFARVQNLGRVRVVVQ